MGPCLRRDDRWKKGLEERKIMSRGNRDRVMGDAEVIVGKLRAGGKVQGLMKEYRCGHEVLMAAVFSVMTVDEWMVIRNKHLAEGGVKRRFKKGHETWNKGCKGLCYPGSVATQFKKGQIRGNAARKYRPVGSITMRKNNGKLSRHVKVKEHGPVNERYIPLARHRWEKVNGLLPEGMFVVHKDGDTLNDEPGNLRAVDRAGNIKLQHTRDSGIVDRMRAGAAAGNKKKSVNLKRGQSLRAAWARRKKEGVGMDRVVWDCGVCGGEFEQEEKPERCGKCGSFALVKVERGRKKA